MKHKHEKERKRRHRSKSRSRSPIRETRTAEPAQQRNESRSNDQAVVSTSGDGSSLSIAETNKLRIQLGLKPLEVDNSSTADNDGSGKPGGDDQEFVHVPAKNMSDTRRANELVDKLTVQRNKRSISTKLSKVKGLADSSDEEQDSAAAWIKKSRTSEQEKKLAAQRAKMLTELDEEFGVSDLVSEEMQRDRNATTSYRASDLKGLKVEHNISKFKEGTSVILTLKDQGVLDEESTNEQVLVNVNMQDDERTIKSNENKRLGTNYRAYAEPDEEDPDAWMKAPSVLAKYDTVIDGDRRNLFTLGAGGNYGGEDERALAQMKAARIASGMTLEGEDHRLASDFYTESEMETKFKKRKRRVKSVRRALTADDLLFMESPSTSAAPSKSDFGSRNRDKVKTEPSEEEMQVTDDASGENGSHAKIDDSKEAVGLPLITENAADSEDSDDDLSKIVLEPDELQEELQRALAKVRKATYRKQHQDRTSQLAAIVRKRDNDEEEEEETASLQQKKGAVVDGSIVLNTMTEFCRSIGEFGRHEDHAGERRSAFGMMDDQEEGGEAVPMDMDNGESDEESGVRIRPGAKQEQVAGGWQEVDAEPISQVSFDNTWQGRSIAKSVRGVLDDEPQLTQGVVAALTLASKKGYVDRDSNQINQDGKMTNLMAKHLIQEEIRYDDIDSKFRKRDRFSGPLTDFKDKSGYNPSVQLKYVDEAGRDLNTKEAFRQLSHRFHGKGSGKKKTEKRMKKVQDEILMKCMSSSDTPLGTVDKLHKKLETEKQAYVVLSGRNANMQKKLSK